MREASFEEVVEKRYWMATNGWVRGEKEKRRARLLGRNSEEGVVAWGLSTLTRVGWSREEVEGLLGEARRDLRDTNIHAYAEIYVIYGRKPL